MPALDLEKDRVQLFRVDRILSLKNAEKTHEFQMNLTDWFNSYTIKNPVRLYVELTREGIRQCKGMPWLEPYIVTTDNENGYVDTIIDKSEIEFVSNYFFQLGTYARVIEPIEVINNIKEQALGIVNHYK